jgi:hypothetical protein
MKMTNAKGKCKECIKDGISMHWCDTHNKPIKECKIFNIPFNEWSKEKIKQGRKICTSRHKRYSKDKRVTFITPKLPFWFIKTYLWKPEGADSPEELQKVVENIYGRRVPEDETFYVHFGNFRDD